MQGYYQSARDMGNRVSTFFVGGQRRGGVEDNYGSQYQGGGYNQQQSGYGMQGGMGMNNMQGGMSNGMGMQGGMQGGMGGMQGNGMGGMQGGMGGMQGGMGGMQGGMGGMQGGGMMMQGGMGGMQGGMEFGGQRPQQGGNFQMQVDSKNKRRSPVKPGVRRKDGFQCTSQLMFALIAFLTIIIGGAIAAGVIVSLNVNYRPPEIVAANAGANSTDPI